MARGQRCPRPAQGSLPGASRAGRALEHRQHETSPRPARRDLGSPALAFIAGAWGLGAHVRGQRRRRRRAGAAGCAGQGEEHQGGGRGGGRQRSYGSQTRCAGRVRTLRRRAAGRSHQNKRWRGGARSRARGAGKQRGGEEGEKRSWARTPRLAQSLLARSAHRHAGPALRPGNPPAKRLFQPRR